MKTSLAFDKSMIELDGVSFVCQGASLRGPSDRTDIYTGAGPGAWDLCSSRLLGPPKPRLCPAYLAKNAPAEAEVVSELEMVRVFLPNPEEPAAVYSSGKWLLLGVFRSVVVVSVTFGIDVNDGLTVYEGVVLQGRELVGGLLVKESGLREVL